MANVLGLAFVFKDSQTSARVLFWYPPSIPSRNNARLHDDVTSEEFERVFPAYEPDFTLPSTLESAPGAHLKGRQSRGMGTKSDVPGTQSSASTQNNSMTSKKSALAEFANTFGCSAKTIADSLLPSYAEDMEYEIVLNKTTFVGFTSTAEPHQPALQTTYTMCVAFILDSSTSRASIHGYQQLSRRLSAAIRHEETRTGFLTEQVQLMIKVHDEHDPFNADDLSERLLQTAALCATLRNIHEDLSEQGKISTQIGGWVSVNFCAAPEELPNRGFFSTTGAIPPRQLRPFHTILLHASRSTVLGRLPRDASPALIKLIQYASPLKSFEVLSQETGISLPQVLRLAVHLVAWHEAKIIYTICASNIYVVAQSLLAESLSVAECHAFAQAFPNHSLPAMLDEFSRARPLADHMRVLDIDEQRERLLIVQWLLQREMLVPLHTYAFLAMPYRNANRKAIVAETDRNPDTFSSADAANDSTEMTHIVTEDDTASASIDMPHAANDGNTSKAKADTEPSNKAGDVCSAEQDDTKDALVCDQAPSSCPVTWVSGAEYQTIVQLHPHVTVEQLRAFLNLCQFLRGQHTLEDMMWQSNLTRDRLDGLLATFAQVVVKTVF